MVAAISVGLCMNIVAQSSDDRFATAGRLSISCVEDAAAIEGEWRHLERTGVGTLFQRFDWVDAWCRTIGRADAARPSILFGVLDGLPAFVLPLGVRRAGPVRIAEFLGGSHSGYNFGLWSLEGAAQMRALPLAARLGEALGVDVAVLRRMPSRLAGIDQPLASLPSRPSDVAGYSVSLEGGMESLLGRTGGGARRRRANQKERRMRELGPVLCGPAGDLATGFAALDFFAEEKARRLAEQGLRNPFAEEGAMEFLRELVRRSAGLADPLLQMHVLSVDGKTRAVIGTGAHRGDVTLQILTYSRDEMQPHSPGQVLLYRNIEASAEAGRAVYDFGVGQEGYKDSWADTAHTLNDHFAAFTPAGHLALASLRLRGEVRAALRGNPLASGLMRAWRRRGAEAQA